jgi:hypothetical protein
MAKVWALALVIADGAHYAPPEPSVAESTIGLLATAFATWLFVRALFRGSGPLGR